GNLLAAAGSSDRAIAAATAACRLVPVPPAALDELASILADIGDVERLEPVATTLQQVAGDRATTAYYMAAARFMRRDLAAALRLAGQAVAIDPGYAAAYNLAGAIEATLGDRL